jgi:diguanylate cyclase (GGDEF)-like protein
MKVLVVDDSKMIREMAAECVHSMGHEVIFAEDGEQALAYVQKNSVDLILMDVEMPGMNGLEATHMIRKIKQDDWFPIVFLSSRNNDESFADGILAGGDAYLVKPLNVSRLQLTVIAMERIYAMRQKLAEAQLKLTLLNQELEKLSLFDSLTGLANRRNFDQTLEKEFKLAQRNKAPMSLIICDIDFFKLYNDHYGHQKGDECLATVAKMVGASVRRPTDLACRYGGEEFTVILPATNLEGGWRIAEQIRQAVEAKEILHAASKVAGHVTLSLGVATYYGQLKQPDELLKQADNALYLAKEKGRNRTELA